jgi:hypothetical protein
MRLGFLSISWISIVIGGLLSSGCNQYPQTEVGFVLKRLEDLEGGSLSLRDAGLDRTHVVEATCQILKSDGTIEAGETFEVNPETVPGEQEVRLRGIRAGSNYYARILGLDDQGAVYECGVSGPLTIKSGNKHFVEIVIMPPPDGDPGCDQLCAKHEDCPPGAFCLSPLAGSGSECIAALNCTPALCKPFSVGAPCEVSEDCGPELGCISPGFGYPGGYCMKSCASDADCPQGQNWSSSCCPGNIAGLANSICSRDCLSDGDCREADGYVCESIDTNKSGCLPL